MAKKVTPHPLEDEDVLVTVLLDHTPTGARGMASAMAPADGGYDISEAVELAKQQAMDKLLAAIEQIGG